MSQLRADVDELRAKVATLEHLLEMHERLAAQQTGKLESANVEIERRNRELLASEQAKSELVDRLRIAVDELSTPILEVWDDVLALPIIGLVDSRRAAQIMERLLDEIVRKQSSYVIIDVTGVEVIDSKTAEHFTKLVRAVELLGARCVLTGIRPAVGQTLLDLGLELGSVRTLRNLKHALRTTLKLMDDKSRPRRIQAQRRARRMGQVAMESSVPILYFDDKVVVTLGHGAFDEETVDELGSALATAIEERDAGGLVIDVSGVAILDSHLTRVVRDLALMAKLMGIKTVVCGLRPAVAITLVEMGLELPGVHTALSLDHAVRWLSSGPERHRPAITAEAGGSRGDGQRG